MKRCNIMPLLANFVNVYCGNLVLVVEEIESLWVPDIKVDTEEISDACYYHPNQYHNLIIKCNHISVHMRNSVPIAEHRSVCKTCLCRKIFIFCITRLCYTKFIYTKNAYVMKKSSMAFYIQRKIFLLLY